jgi:DNA-binding response OmpR family regulator
MTKCPCCGSEVEIKRPLLDLVGNAVAWEDKIQALTPRVAEVLSVLIDAYPGHVQSKAIFDRVFGKRDANQPSCTVHVFIKKLRKRLPHIGWDILTAYGRGYALQRIQESQASAT